MRVSVYVPLALSLLLAAGGPLLARSLAPRTAARVLTAAVLITSASALWALALLALGLLLDDRSASTASALGDSTPHWAGLLALVFATAALLRVTVVVKRRRRALGFARAVTRGHPAGEGGLVVVADNDAFAVALPGRNGRIVISSAMLARLGPRERRVLLSHERCHVVCRHDLYRLAGDAACAVNPLLGAVRASIVQALERWADEHAAAAVGSRPLVARTLLCAALARPKPPSYALAFTAGGVAARVQALYRRPQDTRLSAALTVLGVALIALATSVDATLAIERLLHLVTFGR